MSGPDFSRDLRQSGENSLRRLSTPLLSHLLVNSVLLLAVGLSQLTFAPPVPLYLSQCALLIWFTGYLVVPHNLAPELRRAVLRAMSGRLWTWSGIGPFSCLAFVCLAFSVQAVSKGTLTIKPILESGLSPYEQVMVVLLAPIIEEFYFRIIVQTIWSVMFTKHNVGPWAVFWPIYLTSLVFSIFHVPFDPEVWKSALAVGSIPFHPGPFFLGLWCGVLMFKERSVFWPIAAHSLANLLTPIWNDL
jgi:membrane protease YdiL (CAAX protease family)